MRKTRCGQMRRRRLLPGCTQGCYRDQSQKPLTGKEPSRAYARPGALRPSLTAAAGARQSSCRSSRQKESFSMSSRRELAARTVFCFFFGGDKLATPSLAADRATAFSGAAAAASLPAGTALGGLPRQGRVCRRRRDRCGRFAATQREPRDQRTVDCFPDPHHPCLGSDNGRDGRRGCLAGSLGGHFGGRLRRRGCAGVTLGAGRARIRTRAAAGTTLLGCRGMRSFGDLHRCVVRMAKGDDTGYAKRSRDATASREIAAMRSSRRNRGVEKKARTRDADLNVPCAHLAKERDKNFQAAERFRRMKENDIPWRGVRRRPQKNQSRQVGDSEGTRRFLPCGNLTCPVARNQLQSRNDIVPCRS